jgi:3-hydroxyisobutyrate dehydrogenase-like beta-hydroxyacid dehydrogenase
MPPLIAIIGTGAMGSAVARRLVGRGCRVITVLEGRSAASAQRAQAAGMTAVAARDLATADFVLSIVPPAVAVGVARQSAPLLATAATRGVYVDCNAVSPKTAREIAALIEPSGWAFADAGIIGLPPSESGHTVFYAAGAAARRFAAINDYGLDVRVLDGPVGAASALKMSYAGLSKGVTAICTAMLLAASRTGAAEALRAELADSRPELLAWARHQVPGAFPKAYRWVAEMEEIAEFASEDPAAQQIFLGIARLYERLAADVAGPNADTRALLQFLGDRKPFRC